MSSKPILLITGSNQGLGLIAVRKIVRSGDPYHIIITSRTLSKANAAVEAVKKEFPDTQSTFSTFELDTTDPASVSAMAKKLEAEVDHIDILANNAGLNVDSQIPATTDNSPEALAKRAELINHTYASNITGHDIVTVAVLPLLLKSKNPRLVFTSSGLASLGWASGKEEAHDAAGKLYVNPIAPVYRSSKTALTMLALMWGKQLKDKGVETYTLDPGFNATGFAGNAPEANAKMGAQDPEIGGGFIADVIMGKKKEAAFKFSALEGEVPF